MPASKQMSTASEIPAAASPTEGHDTIIEPNANPV